VAAARCLQQYLLDDRLCPRLVDGKPPLLHHLITNVCGQGRVPLQQLQLPQAQRLQVRDLGRRRRRGACGLQA
jgi:hypothetical protein